jgi:hypothetical protein
MKFEISFEETIFKEKMKLNFHLAGKKSLKNTRIRLLSLILILIVHHLF